MGRCPSCGEWNSFTEEVIAREASTPSLQAAASIERSRPQRLDEIRESNHRRIDTGYSEVNRVLGGGLVPGSLVLLGGEPGIGKSTLSLQLALTAHSLRTLYVSGEESAEQIGMRAERLGIANEECYIYSETLLENILLQIQQHQPDVVVIDSIQTIYTETIDSSAGSVSQIRECAASLLKYAKTTGTSIFIIGHITKDGTIAGPKILEHIVDVVLQFEGDGNNVYRILRGIKNRFGSTNEIGVFEMCEQGLAEVENPSLMLISGKPKNTPGSCIACVMEGSRPIMAEVQALVTPTGFGNPRRMSTGFDYNRVSMLLAVLEKRAGFYMNSCDAYVNVVGGLRLDEPATDLAVALAMISGFKDTPIRDDTLVLGEIGLGGELRSVSNCEQRIKEAERLGFNRCIIPRHNLKTLSDGFKGNIEIIGVRNINEAYEAAI